MAVVPLTGIGLRTSDLTTVALSISPPTHSEAESLMTFSYSRNRNKTAHNKTNGGDFLSKPQKYSCGICFELKDKLYFVDIFHGSKSQKKNEIVG